MNDKVYNALFGSRVRFYREKKKLTQKELATKLGYTASATIGRIENGQQTIPLSKLPDFCVALDVQPFDLIGLSDHDKQIWKIAETMIETGKDENLQKFIELYVRLLKGEK